MSLSYNQIKIFQLFLKQPNDFCLEIEDVRVSRGSGENFIRRGVGKYILPLTLIFSKFSEFFTSSFLMASTFLSLLLQAAEKPFGFSAQITNPKF